MQRTMINHARLRVWVKSGSEGPRHDPYAYTEHHVTVHGHTVTLHEGLGTWLKLDENKLTPPKELSYEEQERWLRFHAFPALTGYTVTQLERLERKIKERCTKCGCRDFKWESGYPGEEFMVCVKCNHVNDCTFDESAVM